MEENRQKKLNWKNVLPEFITMIIAGAGIYGYSFIGQVGMEITLRNIVMSILGIAIIGYLHRLDYVSDMLDYNNGEHLMRFWMALWCGMVIAFACVFLPVGGWPFLPIYVLLSLVGNMSAGVLAASVLLMISVFMADAAAGIFFLYFISGIFGASLFRHLKNGFTIGVPWFLSMLCLLVCETANIVLTINEQLSFEQFLVPGANLVVSSVLLLGILKWFSGKVVYQYREFYLEWNDTENPVLAEYKKTDREAYFVCVHTAYFCERIARKLSLDADAIKCAGYYHKMEKEYEVLLEEHHFPPMAKLILQEYHTRKNAVIHKETAVLLCSNSIVNSMMYVFSKNKDKQPDYDQVIDTVFKKFHEAGTFRNCNISMQELNTMQKIFKEEKLYYDFLR